MPINYYELLPQIRDILRHTLKQNLAGVLKCLAKRAVHKVYLSPVRRYPDIFKSATFFPDLKISPSTHSVFKSNSSARTLPMVSGFTPEKQSLHIVQPYWFIVR